MRKKVQHCMKLERLAGKIALGSAYAKDYTDWAESMLHEGVESENVAILAGIGLERDPDSEEVKAYFQKSLIDLGLALPSEEHALEIYAKVLLQARPNAEGDLPEVQQAFSKHYERL